jgi:uncharacterized protein (TIGR00299 family) protein
VETAVVSQDNVLIDVAEAGASGDMFLSALIALSGDDDSLVPVAASLLIYDPTLRVTVDSVEEAGLQGKRLDIKLDKKQRFSPSSLEEIVTTVAEEVELSKKGKDFAEKVLQKLFQAEMRAHDVSNREELHLHELGSIDSALDILGAAYLLEKLNLLGTYKFVSTKVAVGSGTVKTEHGELEVPVPAVSEILVEHDVPFHTGPGKTETLTPTGAAILVTLVEEWVETTDDFTIESTGIGFGSRSLEGVPNAFKLHVGESKLKEPPPKPKKPAEPEPEKPKKATKAKKKKEKVPMSENWESDEVVVIETNVDDTDGEIMGTMFDLLLGEDLAYDVVMIPAYGKKNRPCFIVKVIARKESLNEIAAVMMKHLGTIGIRYTNWDRLKASRETIVTRLEIDEHEFMVRVKVARGPDGSVINIKPEADDVLKVSQATDIPIREIKQRVALQAHAITE